MLNMNFDKRLVIHTTEKDWLPSPMQGVSRIPLEREAAESGRTTSVVRYDVDSKFSEHFHPGGEEIFVLAGTFSDENGDYPAGTYIRNPPGSNHAPFSKEGCLLYVKLNQFSKGDNAQIIINTTKTAWHQGIGNLQVMPLHNFQHENIALVKWPANEKFQPHRHFGGEEIFVLSGTFQDEFGAYPKYSWIRSPHLSQHFPFTEEETIILVKTGHLPID
ncbi:cupin domain-containing protein [Kangiella sp. HZ709]|uniref:cupin domain-containing protein n=1 Tax=Kangiella sp. HZ709 TaxID=2666328 RepID=UPI0012B09549|nr:cupin domain-containing protein [Kangiella sp. HZ709]MRX28584.1 cupin [Kangiella sp. HZ709]